MGLGISGDGVNYGVKYGVKSGLDTWCGFCSTVVPKTAHKMIKMSMSQASIVFRGGPISLDLRS